MKTDRIKEEMMYEASRYSAVARDIQDTAELLHSIWHDESGDRLFRRVENLTEDMNDNYERLRKWIGSGSL